MPDHGYPAVPPSVFPDLAALSSVCRRRIRRLSLFRSTLVGTDRPDSDIDLLIEFASEARPSFFDMVDMERELSALLDSRRIDLRAPQDLSRHFRDDAVHNAAVRYASPGYTDLLEVPFIFLSNREEIWFFDKAHDARFSPLDGRTDGGDCLRQSARIEAVCRNIDNEQRQEPPAVRKAPTAADAD
jgi:predicted nucleotidyltransferase